MACVKNEKGEYECCSDPVSTCEFYSSDCWLPKSQCWNLGARRQADDKATIAEQKATIERLTKAFSAFGGYVLACRKSNTRDYMVGLAEAANDIPPEVRSNDRWLFDGDSLRRLTVTFEEGPKP